MKINAQQSQTFYFYRQPLTRTKHKWYMSLYVLPSWQVAPCGPVRQEEFMSTVTQLSQPSKCDLWAAMLIVLFHQAIYGPYNFTLDENA